MKRLVSLRAVLPQLGLVMLLWLGSELLVRAAKLPMPGGILGMAVLLLLLLTGVVDISAVKRGADWLLAQMLVFFVPAMLAVMEHREFLGVLGLKILFVIVASTAAVMAVTVLVVEWASPGESGAQGPLISHG
jgi:holin-like protein